MKSKNKGCPQAPLAMVASAIPLLPGCQRLSKSLGCSWPCGMNAPAIYGDVSRRVAIILESEFDAILIQQFAADLCFCIATGGSTQPLDLYTDHLMRKTLLLLICPDVDTAGAKFLQKIKANYKQSKLWPAPLGKSPGDALKDHKIDLRQWILQGLPEALRPPQNMFLTPLHAKPVEDTTIGFPSLTQQAACSALILTWTIASFAPPMLKKNLLRHAQGSEKRSREQTPL